MFDGKAYGEGIVEIVRGYVEREIAPIKAENESLKARVAELESRTPEKGEKGDPGDKGEKGDCGEAGQNGADGKDAAGIVEALKDSGELVLTLEDGRLVRTGIRDGEKGLDGKDGRDGFGFDDLDACVLDDDRTIELSFRKGEEEKAFTFKWPTVIDRGVYKAGETYERGDGVTWGGSWWIAQRQTEAKPDTSDSGWRLAVKKGRDGKDAKNG